uniref:PLAT domain-containing protein n=1 Tax=Clastoptera arizonana TaxID=38151 RepID=A0A1B6CIR1_9HEMI
MAIQRIEFNIVLCISFVLFVNSSVLNVLKQLPYYCRGGELCEPCGICSHTDDVNKDECNKQFFRDAIKDLHAESIYNQACKKRDKCNDKPCEHSKQCESLFGSRFCVCEEGYYGADCSKRLNSGVNAADVASGISVKYVTDVEALKGTFILICIRNPGKYLEVHVDHGLDFTEIQNIYALRRVSPFVFDQECKILPFWVGKEADKKECRLFTFKTTYPIDLKEDEMAIMNVNNNKFSRGRKYLMTIKVLNLLKVDNWDPVVFEKKYLRVVWFQNYEALECIPTVEATFCSRDNGYPTVLFRNQALRIDTSVTLGEDDCKNFQILRFIDMWNETKNFFQQKNSLLKFYRPKYSILTKDPYFFMPGTYRVVVLGSLHLDGILISNLHYCFFEVKYSDLEATISGGSSRQNFFKSPLILDASKSYDPNERLDNQGHLRYKWSCLPETEEICKVRYTLVPHLTIPGPFTPGSKFTFLFTLYTTDPKKEPKTVRQRIKMVRLNAARLSILCLKNCGVRGYNSTTHEIVYFKVVIHLPPGPFLDVISYNWTYMINNNENELDAVAIKQPETPNSILIVDEEMMAKGSMYTFVVKGPQESEATYEINTGNDPIAGSCDINPKEGIMGVTNFTIICEGFKSLQIDRNLDYEFYDNKPDQPGLGTYIGSTKNGDLKKVFLVGGVVTVHVMDTIKMFVTTKLTATVRIENFQQSDIAIMVNKLRILERSGNKIGLMRQIAVLAEVMFYYEKKADAILTSLDILNQVVPVDLDTVKLISSGLANYLEQLVLHEDEGLTSHPCQLAGYIMFRLGSKFQTIVTQEIDDEYDFETRSFRQISRNLINAANALLVRQYEDDVVKKVVLTFLETHKLVQYREGFIEMKKSLEYCAHAVGSYLLPYQKIFNVTTESIEIWVRLSEEASEMGEYLQRHVELGVNISSDLAVELEKKPGHMTIETVTFTKNPFWWYRGGYRYVNSTILSLKLKKKITKSRSRYEFRTLTYPVDLYLNLSSFESSEIFGTINQLEATDDVDKMDDSVSIHRIETHLHAKLFLQFIQIPVPLKVLVLKDRIPDFDSIEKFAIVIDENNTKYDIHEVLFHDKSFFYIGILPDTKEKFGKKKYSFNVTAINCRYWKEYILLGSRCVVGQDSTIDQIHCMCHHFTSFIGAKLEAKNLVNIISDPELIPKPMINILVVMFIIFLLLLYPLVMILSLYMDRKAQMMEGFVTLLRDNYPGEEHGYLVAVFTGPQFLAGTEANVGIRLIGEKNTSRAHILASTVRSTLQRNGDDWFLLFTGNHLGEIEKIHVWHDNSGYWADWYCTTIKVFDLESKVEYVFPVNQWLATGEKEYLEVIMNPLPKHQAYTKGNLISRNLAFGFRDIHVWLSLYFRHPRCAVKRPERATVCMCYIMLTSFISILFYGIPDTGEDDPVFHLGLRELLCFFTTVIIVTPIIYLVFRLFRKQRVELRTNDNIESMVDEHNEKGKDNSSILEKIKKNTMIELLNPVRMEYDKVKKKTTIKKAVLIGWLLSLAIICISLIGICVFGLYLGMVKSRLWLFIVMLVLLFDILIFLPLRIVILAVLLGFVGKKIYNETTYEIDIEKAKNRELAKDSKYIDELNTIRSQPMYYPIFRFKILFNRISVIYLHP